MPPKKTRSTLQGNLLPGDLTPGQYVIGICVALFFALACFGLGVVVGRREPNPTPPAAQQKTETKTAARDAGEGVQTTPRRPETAKAENEPRRPSLSPAAPAAETPAAEDNAEAKRPAGNGAGVVVRPNANGVTVTPNAPAAPTPPAAVETPTPPTEKPAEADKPPAPAEKPVTTAAATPSTPPAQEKPAPTATPITPADDETAPSAKPAPQAAPPPPASNPGKWGIQVASLSGPTRQKGAEDLIRRLRENAGLTAQAVPTGDGAALRVLIVGFDTKEAANKACAELKQKPDFKGAWVKQL